jgi:hypothetical protein
MINLMEGIMAVPGLNEKSTSEKQARFMAAAAHNPDFAKKTGMNQDVAKEFNKADTGTKQLSNAMKEDTESDMQTAGTVGRNQDYASFDQSQGMATESVPAIDSCNQGNPMDADAACAMEGMGERSDVVAQAMSDFQNMVMNHFMEPEDAFDRISANLDPDSLAEFEQALEQEGLMSYGDDPEMNGPDDMSADADALASAGHGSDEDYGGAGDMEFEEAFDLQNGYDEVNDASGNDYFPNGADSPVVRATGPSGARQGDNPEQKKMQIAEVHKELVYSYRSFLGETAKPKKKVN